MESVSQIIERAEQRCKASGTRLTEKRKLALSSLAKSGKALSAYELVEAYNRDWNESMPAMSMYRILDFLASEHLVHRLELANKYIACEHTHDAQGCAEGQAHTQFLICNQCQKVKEIEICENVADALTQKVNGAGFHLASAQLEMNCICEDCLPSTRKENPK